MSMKSMMKICNFHKLIMHLSKLSTRLFKLRTISKINIKITWLMVLILTL